MAKKPHLHTHAGLTLSPAEWANRLGITSSGMTSRLRMLRLGKITEDECFKSGQRYKFNSITYNGETHTVPEWSRILGIPYYRLDKRLRDGLPLERIFHSGPIPHKERRNLGKTSKSIFYEVNGVTGTLPDLCRQFGVPYDKAHARIYQQHRSISEALDLVPFESRRERKITIDGQTKNLSEWAKSCGLNYPSSFTIRYEHFLKGKITKEQLLQKERIPQVRKVAVKVGDKIMSPTRAAREIGLSENTFERRKQKGMTALEALTTPLLTHAEIGEIQKRNRRMKELRKLGFLV